MNRPARPSRSPSVPSILDLAGQALVVCPGVAATLGALLLAHFSPLGMSSVEVAGAVAALVGACAAVGTAGLVMVAASRRVPALARSR